MDSAERSAVWLAGTVAATLIYSARQRLAKHWYPLPHFEEKAKSFVGTATADNLLVITDFDATLTAGDSIQCHDLLPCTDLLTPEFRRDFMPLTNWTNDNSINVTSWWDTAHGMMLRHGQPPKYLLPRLVAESGMYLRPGALELLSHLAENRIPLLIVSAGLSDIIEEFLRQQGLLTENVTVCSNRLNYGADSAPKSVEPSPPITSFTKHTAYSASSSFFKTHEQRTSILIMGDNATDVQPAVNVPNADILSVGFLNVNSTSSSAAAAHVASFDALILGSEGSFDPVLRLVKRCMTFESFF